MAAKNDDLGHTNAPERKEQTLLDLWDTVLKTHRMTREAAQTDPTVTQSNARVVLYYVVKDFARAAKTVLRPPGESELPTSRDWWNDVELGEQDVPGPNRAMYNSVADWYSTEVPQQYSWDVVVDAGLSGSKTETQTATFAPAMEISMTAAEVVNYGLADLGYGLDPSPDSPDHDFQYEHLAPAEKHSQQKTQEESE